ncbi:MAG: hypothetical protein SNJ56_07155 [Termitinemataceae bacterium]
MNTQDSQLTLTISEILLIFPYLKAQEDQLSEEERDILYKMEDLLYQNLSIDDMERLLQRIQS